MAGTGEKGTPSDAHRRSDARSLHMERYGIDDRARSALRALARQPGLDAASRDWAAAVTERLINEAGPRSGSDERTLASFIAQFFQLPARDLDPQWIDDLVHLWDDLRAAGCDADLPMRAAYHFTQQFVAAMKRGRDSYSSLDAEIAFAVGAASLFVCGVLVERSPTRSPAEPEPTPGAEFTDGGSRSVRIALSATLGANHSGFTGLLIGQVEAGSTAVMAMEEEGWAHIYARSLSRLRHALREKDVLCRIGRSRFAVVLPHLSSQAQVLLAANKVARTFDPPLVVAGREFRLWVRIGAAWAPDHGRDGTDLLRSSSLALREALRIGRPVATFEPALQEKAERDSRMEEDFLRALDCGGLDLYFQPQIDLRTGRCVGAEALLRWPGGRFGPVAPPLTIEVAERLGMTSQLTRWVLHHSCRAIAEFAALGIAIEVSVNLTATDVADPELPLAVRNAMELWHVEPKRLKFELTESAMLANEAVTARVMASLCELGVATSIDDFGTGYSSVILLKKLPLDELKLDRSFVSSAVHSRQDREIVRSLILLAHSLNLEVVAEGVEDETTLALLRDFGCDRAQGFLINQALPFEQFRSWMRSYVPGSRFLGGAAPAHSP